MTKNAQNLNETEMENVTGGAIFETWNDYKELVKMGLMAEPDGSFDALMGAMNAEDVRNTFAKYGVALEDHGGFTDNIYRIDGKEVTEEDALAYVRSQLK